MKTSAPFPLYSISGHSFHGDGEICLVSIRLPYKWEHTAVLDIWKMSLKLPGPWGHFLDCGRDEWRRGDIRDPFLAVLPLIPLPALLTLVPWFNFHGNYRRFVIIKSDTFYFHRPAFQRFSEFWFIIFPQSANSITQQQNSITWLIKACSWQFIFEKYQITVTCFYSWCPSLLTFCIGIWQNLTTAATVPWNSPVVNPRAGIPRSSCYFWRHSF